MNVQPYCGLNQVSQYAMKLYIIKFIKSYITPKYVWHPTLLIIPMERGGVFTPVAFFLSFTWKWMTELIVGLPQSVFSQLCLLQNIIWVYIINSTFIIVTYIKHLDQEISNVIKLCLKYNQISIFLSPLLPLVVPQ